MRSSSSFFCLSCSSFLHSGHFVQKSTKRWWPIAPMTTCSLLNAPCFGQVSDRSSFCFCGSGISSSQFETAVLVFLHPSFVIEPIKSRVLDLRTRRATSLQWIDVQPAVASALIKKLGRVVLRSKLVERLDNQFLGSFCRWFS